MILDAAALGRPNWPATVLRNLRRSAGLTQIELADRSGLSVRAIGDLERGRTRRPRRQSLVLLASALGVPLATILSPHGPESPTAASPCSCGALLLPAVG